MTYKTFVLWVMIMVMGVASATPNALGAGVFEGIASWYDSNSVKKEGTCHAEKCYTASGKEIHALEKMGALFTASNDYPIGTRLRICNRQSKVCVDVTVLDRGGFKKYGRSVDLCKKAFGQIAPTRQGIVKVTITELKKGGK